MNRKRLIFRTLSGTIALAILLAGCGGSDTSGGTSVGEVSTVTITDTIETSGNLGADQLVTLTWGTSGLVEKVNVKVGQKAKKDDVLAILVADSVPADIVSAQAELAQAQYDLQNLTDSKATLAQAQLDVIAARKDVEEAENNLAALDYPRASDILIQNTEAQIKEAERDVTLATKRYKEYQDDPDGSPSKIEAEVTLTNAQLKLNELRATLNWYLGKPSQSDYDEAHAQLDLARANLAEARRKRDSIKNGVDPLALAAAQAKVAEAHAKVNAMAIIAPFDGEVIVVQAKQDNSVNKDDVAVGMVNRNTIKIDTLIDESSIGSVSVGDVAEVTMDSLPDVTLSGRVTLVDPIGSTVNGLVKYTVVVSLDPTNEPLLFGATANVVILTSEPYSMLAVPVGAVQSNTRGEYVIRIAEDGSSQRVSVVSGELAGNLVTITGDLKEGDKVQMGTASSTESNSSSTRGGNGDFGGPFGP